MISSNDLKPGQTINVDGDIYVVLDISQNKTASAMVVKAKVRNLRTGSMWNCPGAAAKSGAGHDREKGNAVSV